GLRRAFLRHRFTYSRLFRRWHAARRCGTAAYRSTHDARGRGSILDRETLAEPRRRLVAARAHAARGAQSRPQISAHGMSRRHKRMQQLARKYEAELSFDFSNVVGEVTAPRPTPLSMMREILADGHGFATAMFDVQSRLLKPV